jgi:hypothetical protein
MSVYTYMKSLSLRGSIWGQIWRYCSLGYAAVQAHALKVYWLGGREGIALLPAAFRPGVLSRRLE